ncbi:TRAP transporter permease [Oceanithermus desulfurans]
MKPEESDIRSNPTPAGDTGDLDKAVELMQEVEYGARDPRAAWQKWLIFLIAVAWSTFQVWATWKGNLDILILGSIHLAFAFALAFLAYPSKNPPRDAAVVVLTAGVVLNILTAGKFFIWIALATLLAGVAIWYATPKRAPRDRVPWVDWAVLAMGLAGALYIVYDFNGIVLERGGVANTTDIIMGTIALAALFLATIRVVGVALLAISGVLILYAVTGPKGLIPYELPDIIYLHSGYPWRRIVEQLYLTTEGIWGTPIQVSARFVFLFVLFGALLDKAGAGKYFVDLAYSGLGTYRGGPAKAAVVGSMLTGIISGSSIANVVTTGTFTIPLMKKVGYPPEKAGATEVGSSTNGQLMPPVMGAAAFIMAEFLDLPYYKLIIYAAVPAVLSYIGLFYVVHLEALKLGLKGLSKSELPAFWPTFFSGAQYLIPVGWLMYELVGLRHTPERSALNAMFMLIGMIVMQRIAIVIRGQKGNFADYVIPMGLMLAFKQYFKMEFEYAVPISLVVFIVQEAILAARARHAAIGGGILRGLWEGVVDIVQGFEAGARNMTSIAIATASAGIIVGIVTMTGLGFGLADIVEAMSGGNIMLVLIISAVASLVLGMGLPTTANYIVMASLIAPVIANLADKAEFAVPIVAVHLFVFYFGILADDTPPVGLAAYAAAAIARSDPIKTGVQGFIYDMRTAILPFIFFFKPALLLIHPEGHWSYVVYVVLTALVAMLLFVAGTQGWWLTRATWPERIGLLLASFLLFTTQRMLHAIGIDSLANLPDFLRNTLGMHVLDANPDLAYAIIAVILIAAVFLSQRARIRREPQPA